jgi:hypothetical protein
VPQLYLKTVAELFGSGLSPKPARMRASKSGAKDHEMPKKYRFSRIMPLEALQIQGRFLFVAGQSIHKNIIHIMPPQMRQCQLSEI